MRSRCHFLQGANIFVDSHGQWLLGDFGSAVNAGDFITYKLELTPKETPAEYVHDCFMLAVALAVEVSKESWKELLIEKKKRACDSRVSDERLWKVCSGVQDTELRAFLLEILCKAGVQ
jgi:hypothetical protein